MISFLTSIYIKHTTTIHNFGWRAIQVLAKQGINFLIFLLCAKFLSPYNFGLYNYILTIVFFLVMFGDFGISSATSKYIAEYGESNQRETKKIIFNSILIISLLGTFITILSIILGKIFLKDLHIYLLYTLPLLFLAPVSSLYDGVYRGLKKFKELAIINLIIGIFSVIFIYLFIHKLDLIGALISQSLYYFLLVLTLSFKHGSIATIYDSSLLKKIVSYSSLIGLSTFGFYLYTRFDILILGHFNFVEEINSFQLIAKITVLLALAFTILGQVIAPYTTALVTRKENKKILNKFIKYSFLGFLLASSLTIVIYYITPFLLGTFLSHLLTDHFLYIFRIIIWTLPFNLLSPLIAQGFTVASGNAKIGLLTIPFGITNVILAFFLIKQFGFIGIAYSSVTISILSKSTSWILLYRKFRSTSDRII